MAVSEKFKGILGFLTSGFEGKGQDMFDSMIDDLEPSYPVQDNLALEPVYNQPQSSRPNTGSHNDLKVVNHPSFKGYEVLVCEPRSYDECTNIVKYLKDKKTIILNLHLLDREQSLRMVDFVCGATHALNGNQQKIGESVFIFTPTNVSLTAASEKSKFLRDALWNQTQP